MLAVAVAGLVAAAGATAAVHDTSLRVPGTALRFGSSLVQVERVIRTQPVAANTPVGTNPGATARQTRLRFFGLDGEATLGFEDGVLVGVQVTVAQPSPHDIDYVEDDLARQGFHRRCDVRDGINRTCEWTARARVRLTTSATSLAAGMEPIVEPQRSAVGGGGAPAATAPPETLAFAAPSPSDSLPAPVVLDSCVAVRPSIARQSGVFGRVVIEVSVDTSGRVGAARVVRGVPMLDDAALECARRYRFAPYLRRGRAHPFRVALSIRFTL
jgi:TonB family protein